MDLRTSFNREAQLYHEIRPRYPEQLFDMLVKVTNLHHGSNLLEIGPGTGQATEALARRGYPILAVELGADLADVAREALKKYENVVILTGAFEDVEIPLESFDLVYAATAFHWIKSEVRFTKPYNLLKQNGHLAIIHTNHVSDELGDRFFLASQPIYKKYQLDEKDDKFRPPLTSQLNPEELDESLFTLAFFRTFPIVLRYTAAEYAKLLNTYSPILSMRQNERVDFLKDISKLIEEDFGGGIDKHFAMSLTIAQKRRDR